MTRPYILMYVLLFLFVGNCYAQRQTTADRNPFADLHFNGPTDTVTLSVVYDGTLGKLNSACADMLAVINKNNRSRQLTLENAIGFTIPGNEKKYYAPCRDESILKALSSATNTTKLRLQCIVYRFYYLDEASNFFYIDKAWVDRTPNSSQDIPQVKSQ